MTVKKDDIVSIQRSFPDQERLTAAAIYYQAFRKKLSPLLGKPGIAVPFIADVLNPEMCLAALVDGRVVGIAGLHRGDAQFVQWKFEELSRHFGWFSAIWRFGVAFLFMRSLRVGELLMDGIAVAETMRGKGIGTRLLNAIVAFGKDHDYTAVRLDVVDTNPEARRLYERFGFEPVRTRHFPLMRFFGFTAATSMIKAI